MRKEESFYDFYQTELKNSDYDSLTAEEERELVLAYKNGDQKAGHTLILRNTRNISYLVETSNVYTSNKMDLFQSGIVGLMEALLTYDPDRGVRLFTYAKKFINKHIVEETDGGTKKLYIPEHMKNHIRSYNRIIKKAERENRTVPDEEIIKEFGISKKTLKTIKYAANISYRSIDSPINSENFPDKKILLSEVIPAKTETIAPNLMEDLKNELLKRSFERLTEREYDIVVKFYGLNGEIKSAAELAKKYGVRKRRIYQILNEAYLKMKVVFLQNDIHSTQDLVA